MKTLIVKKSIEFSETDLAGIVHFSNFAKYIELAEHEFFRKIGSSVVLPRDDFGNHYGWPRKSASFEFLSPLRFEDNIEIRMTMKSLRAATMTYCCEIYLVQEKSDVLVARAEATIVYSRFYDQEDRIEALIIPDALRRKIEQFWLEKNLNNSN